MTESQLNINIPEALDNIRHVSDILPEPGKKIKALEFDPEYVAIDIKARFSEAVLQTMKTRGMNKNDLAEKLGKSRQYVGRVLNENANFTIETMAGIACALGMKLTIGMSEPKNQMKTADSMKSVSETNGNQAKVPRKIMVSRI